MRRYKPDVPVTGVCRSPNGGGYKRASSSRSTPAHPTFGDVLLLSPALPMSDTDTTPPIAEPLLEQTEELCDLHDHITRVVTGLDVPRTLFSDRYPDSGRADFGFESVILLFLYQHARGFDQSELHRRLAGTAYVYLRLDLPARPHSRLSATSGGIDSRSRIVVRSKPPHG